MVQRDDLVTLKDDPDLPILARVRKQIAGRVGTVLTAWDPVDGHPAFWMQCTVRFPAVGRKKDVTLDLMQDWMRKQVDPEK
jgi:hypothetical protein